MQPKVMVERLTESQLQEFGCSLKSPKKKKHKHKHKKHKSKHRILSDDDDMPKIFDGRIKSPPVDDESSIGPSVSMTELKSDLDHHSEAEVGRSIKKEKIDKEYEANSKTPVISSVFSSPDHGAASDHTSNIDTPSELDDKPTPVIKKEKVDPTEAETGKEGEGAARLGNDEQQQKEAAPSSLAGPLSQRFDGHTAAVHDICIWKDFIFTASEDHTARRFNLKVNPRWRCVLYLGLFI